MPFSVAEVLPEPLVGETGASVGQSGAKRLLGPLGEAGLLGAVAEGDDRVAQQVGSPRVVQRLGESLGIPEQRRRTSAGSRLLGALSLGVPIAPGEPTGRLRTGAALIGYIASTTRRLYGQVVLVLMQIWC